jgi:hypothetical protein
MTNQVDRAAELLFPASGRQTRDLKFFFQPGATVEGLASHVIACFTALADDSRIMASIDRGLTG